MALRQARISLENSDQKRISTTGRSREVAAPVRAVLHPPVSDPADTPGAARLLGKFADALALLGHTPSTLLLENVRGNDLSALRCVVLDDGFGVCFDTGHALAYGQKKLLRDAVLLERVALLHVSAPGRGEQTGRHLPLSSLDQAGKALCATLCREAPPEAAIMPELFRWKDILDSLPLIRAWLLPQE
jgi:hypothetical protein